MNNISDYIEIPEIILEKWKKKQISPTHFSDYIRSALLAKFGGIWMDATLFCVQELPEEFFSMPFFPGTKYKSIGIRRFKGGLLGFWTTYFMGSNLKNSIIFSFLRDGLLDFWKKNNSVELYSFFDLILLIGFFRIKTIKNHIKSNKTINVNTDSLAKLMSKPFSRSKLNQIKKNQCVFKLSYKKAWKEYYKGERTFYWYCIHEPESLWLEKLK